MTPGSFGWDLPPGVSASMIPGNRPQDEAWEEVIDNATFENVLDYWIDRERDVTGCVAIENDDGTWGIEDDPDTLPGGTVRLETEVELDAYATGIYESEITDAYVDAEVDRMMDGYNDEGW